jgi:eukaryotic-like serine/threonine-protein kinase
VIELGAIIAGKYRVERILGRGGMGFVLQAFHEQLGESVAIKFMVPELATDPDAVARFLREARAAFRIRSEHVARVLDVGEHGGSPFIVMELLSGRDLATEITERFVPSTEAVTFMLQICEALAAAHALGIVHRDLKPSNLFLTRKSDGAPLIKVLDFGISKALDDPNVAPVDSLTMSHRLLGSPHYMSPEQARAPKSADARSDIWSLGVVLYELVLGERPFRGETAVAILASLLSDVVPELNAEQRRKMPDPLMAVILRCLKRDPEQRFADVTEFARALLPMASPHSELVVARIESIARATPVPNTPPAESPADTLKHTHGSTLVSGRSSLAGATSTHLLDSQGIPILQRRFGAKALALLGVIAALFYWFVVRSIPTPHELGAAASAQSDRAQKPSQPARAKGEDSPNHAPSATVEVGPVAPPFEAMTSASAVQSLPVSSARKFNARPQSGGNAPAASTAAATATSKPKALPGPPRPASTADPKNRPD